MNTVKIEAIHSDELIDFMIRTSCRIVKDEDFPITLYRLVNGVHKTKGIIIADGYTYILITSEKKEQKEG